MNEMPKKSSPEAPRETADPYVGWTDNQRRSEYGYTGDPSYLTIELAREMEVDPAVMRKVEGATPEDIEAAEVMEREWEEYYQREHLLPYGLDVETLLEKFDLGPEEYLRHLTDISQMTYDLGNREKQYEDRDAIEQAKGLIVDFVKENERGVVHLCQSVRYGSADGMRDVQMLKYVHNYFYDRFIKVSNNYEDELTEEDIIFAERAAEILNQFSEFAAEVEHTKWHTETNYLTAAYAQALAVEIKFSEPTTLDNDELWLIGQTIGLERVADYSCDTSIPFQITKGQLGLFGVDNSVIYVLDENEIIDPGHGYTAKSSFDRLVSGIRYKVAGQPLAKRVVADFPFDEELETDLEDESNKFIDAARQLGRGDEIMFKDAEQLRDYVYMMRHSMRVTIEGQFNIKLFDLTIQEQIYFLDYLKHTSFSVAEAMRTFIALYGVDGMRTFLSLERGDETLGDHIVAFGQHDEVAGIVFKYYGELLNNSEQAEVLVEEAGCEGEHCVQLVEQVRENIINRAQKDLEIAVRAHDPSEVAAKIETYVADAKVYVALLQEAAQKPLESIPTTEISEEDKMQIRALSARNYVEEPEDFQEVIRSGLEAALSSSNTRFYIERDNEGKVIFYDRFDDKVDVHSGRIVKYFGSVNAELAFNGIGRVRITETLEQELATGETMYAHCDPTNSVSSLYIEHGFVATGIVSPVGKFSFEIWRSKNSSEQLQTKSLSTAELIEQLENQDETVEYEIRKVESGDQFPELSEEKYLTRYFKHNGEYYAVFEPAPAALEAEFVPPQEEREAA